MNLPKYVVVNRENCSNKHILREQAEPFSFPLSDEDLETIQILEAKYDQEKNCSGLAAPQIGIKKQAIIFAVEDTPQLRRWRPDLVEGMPKTIWLNPSYEPLSEETNADYEGCFSVADLACQVLRYKKISYKAYDFRQDQWIEGIAEGFLARVIQHEIDHVHGILCIDKAIEGTILPLEEYRELRKKKMDQED